MKKSFKIIAVILLLATIGIVAFPKKTLVSDSRFISYIVNPKKQTLKLYLKDENQQNFKSINNLKAWLEKKNQNLEFAMNAGMYKTDNSPQGLYIENQKELFPLDTASGNGNFYLKPNGVFYITKENIPFVCATEKIANKNIMKYATQSGPMLVIDGQIHPKFKKGSANLNIRNGVGILPNNSIIFAMSKEEISFYDFASYFKDLGCKNALYLDGFVSRTYLPKENWLQVDGNFGVIVGVTTSKEKQ